MLSNLLILLLLVTSIRTQSNETRNLKFPANFLFGAGSSAIQIEGAWNEDGKGESGYDYFLHHARGDIIDNSTTDVACDSYHLYKQDIPFVKMAGVTLSSDCALCTARLMNTYRFSLSWPRLLPTGDPNNVNQIAVDYYNDLINEVLRYNLTPVVTIHHYDIPLNLTRLGGWANEYIVDHFVAYAHFVLHTFGDRVKYWITINEINQQCFVAYADSIFPPAMNMPGIADYLCGRNSLRAHAKVYRLFQLMPSHIKDGGKMGFTVGYTFFSPYNNLNIFDHLAAESAFEFQLGWILNPVFGSGDYPLLMQQEVDLQSLKEGRKESRLPKFTLEEKLLIKGSADFMGINQYTTLFATFSNQCPEMSHNKLNADSDAYTCRKPNYVTAPGNFMQVVPGSLRDSLTQIRHKYNNPLVLITENGYTDSSQENLLYNPERQSFFQSTISDVFQSMQEGSNLMGYFVWSLLDSFEFNNGYTLKFGMVHVDFTDEAKRRTAKPIIEFLNNVAKYGINVTST